MYTDIGLCGRIDAYFVCVSITVCVCIYACFYIPPDKLSEMLPKMDKRSSKQQFYDMVSKSFFLLFQTFLFEMYLDKNMPKDCTIIHIVTSE